MGRATTDRGEPGPQSESYEGKLELTWTNKHRRCSHTRTRSYEWLPPTDYRIAELRLLRETGEVGELRPLSVRRLGSAGCHWPARTAH